MSSNKCNCETEWYIIIVTLISGIVVGILLSHIVLSSRRKLDIQKSQVPDPKPQGSQVDTTEELDVTKMDTESNYHALRVSIARDDGVNDDESAHTD